MAPNAPSAWSPSAQGLRADMVVLTHGAFRDAAERRVSTLPGAVTTVTDRPDGRRVLVYCTIGFRSGHHTRALRAAGWDDANLAGGVLGCTPVGGPLVRDGIPVAEVHVYGAAWDLARRDVRGGG